jgi:AcrR family transcriptional regulator
MRKLLAPSRMGRQHIDIQMTLCYHMNERSFILPEGPSAMSPSGRGQDTRQALLAAALDLFLHQGYHGTSMRQIAATAGVVPGAVYNHFESKETLYLSLLRDANIYNAIGEALAGAEGDTVEALMHSGAHRLLETLQARSAKVPLVFVDILEFEARNIAILAPNAVSGIVDFFSRLYSLSATSSQLRPVRPDILARSFLGLFASYFITVRFFGRVLDQYPGLDINADAVDDFLDVYMHGALQQSAGAPPEGE